MALAKFWAPVPRMLEGAIILEAVLHEYVETGVIGALLVFNAARVLPGRARTGYSCSAEIEARAYGFGAARWRLEEHTLQRVTVVNVVNVSKQDVSATHSRGTDRRQVRPTT
jgi:hypothetical protein